VNAVELEQIVKTFGPFRALDGLDLVVESGQVHGFLGPNGAGKSTAIRVLLGLLKATRARRRCSAGTPGGRRPSCIDGSPTCPAT
jgi:ABC-2 type transport system ATP-binding protein